VFLRSCLSRPSRLSCLFCFFLAACGGRPQAARESQPSADWFTERAGATGLNFVHANGMSGKFHYAEIIGSGVALFDYDNDGDLDVLLVQYKGRSRLFRNDLSGGKLSFTDVTDRSGLISRGDGMGVATGDFDNDGCVDVYLTNLGPNQLFHNNCDGTFTDVSKQSRTTGESDGWSVSAAFVDYDRDGWLDLFVGNYLRWNEAMSTPCHAASGRPDYCSPNVYQPLPSRLYHNNRDGTFTDVTAAAGVARDFGPTLGVSTADFDNDGWPDVYVANDGQPNQLWINQRDGTFKNAGLRAGAALSASGKAKGSMGVDAGDFDNDGDEDLFMTELTGEGANFFVNDGRAAFEERGVSSGLNRMTSSRTGFGAAWLDIDNDGWLDLLTANGAVQAIEALARVNDPFPLHQRLQLIRNSRNGRFEEITDQGGTVFHESEVGRGAAFGDIDNDGDVDVVVNNNNGPARLLVNNIGNKNHWIGLSVRSVHLQVDQRSADGPPKGGHYDRNALGARVGVVLDNGTTLWRRARSDGSYASANDPRVVVGLGPSAHVSSVRVTWPDGKTETWTAVPIDRYTILREGSSR
jgi:enediyne biosynthesis protein E4